MLYLFINLFLSYEIMKYVVIFNEEVTIKKKDILYAVLAFLNDPKL